MIFEISLPIPPSVNRMYRGGGNTSRRRHFKSRGYKLWEEMSGQILWDRKPLPRFTGASYLYRFFLKDGRSGDLENRLKSVTDFLVKNNILADDNHTILTRGTFEFAGYDKANPRVEIRIEGT